MSAKIIHSHRLGSIEWSSMKIREMRRKRKRSERGLLLPYLSHAPRTLDLRMWISSVGHERSEAAAWSRVSDVSRL
jgi:hypothetical protein